MGASDLAPLRDARVAEVGSFGGRLLNQLSNTSQDQNRRELRGHQIGLTDTEVRQVEFIEFAGRRQPSYTDAQSELKRIVLIHRSDSKR